ncbi:HPF/RaiA family ribosome-associated protein [Flavobacteriaceae bacterium TP-CH-4]|uniref:HPF/RaiA family ribosome-associated protein n=1 Tax=Pelagihabitans pacificus TaxID=2696054 RepID=A0A967ASX8_9FLAO|nr:HPF/RaiA family ribosome-associated protein [Pelagihabitans pacificus]NHF59678.1 HPF/RaiA family ribosome-associated protein [Pelagihabitans pacificus]
MKTHIQFINTDVNPSIQELIQAKTKQLSEKYPWLIRADVIIKEENDPTPKGKISEIRLSAPGPRIFASSDEESFEASIAETIRDLEKQLKKRKGKMNPHL